jgi:hypothetical protein
VSDVPETANAIRLALFVRRCLSAAAAVDDTEAAASQLRANSHHVAGQIRILALSCATGDPCPAHLRGLSAFDLAHAAEQLEAEAVRRRPGAWCARDEGPHQGGG